MSRIAVLQMPSYLDWKGVSAQVRLETLGVPVAIFSWRDMLYWKGPDPNTNETTINLIGTFRPIQGKSPATYLPMELLNYLSNVADESTETLEQTIEKEFGW